MDFALSDAQRAWQETARASGARLAARAAGGRASPRRRTPRASSRADLDAPTAVAIVEAAGIEHPVGAVTLALQVAVNVSLAGAVHAAAVHRPRRGAVVGD